MELVKFFFFTKEVSIKLNKLFFPQKESVLPDYGGKHR